MKRRCPARWRRLSRLPAHTQYGQPITATQTLTWELDASPALALVHTLTSATARIGDTVTYAYVVTNTGRVTLHDLALSSPRLGALPLPPTSLAPGAHGAGAHQFVVTEADLPGPATLGVAVTGANAVAGVRATTVSTLTLAVQPQPGLALTVLPPAAPARSGETVTMRVQITNTGDVTLHNLAVGAGQFGAAVLAATQIAPGAATGGELRILISEAAQPGPAPLTVTASAAPRAGGAPVTATTSAQVALLRPPAFTVTVSAPAQARVGEEIAVTVSIRNSGDATLTGFTLQPPGPADAAAKELAPGQTMATTVYHRVEERSLPGPLALPVSVVAQTRFGAVQHVQAEGAATITLTAQPALEVVAASTPNTATIGADVIITYRVRNRGDVTLTGVTLRDVRAGAIALPARVLAPGDVITGAARYQVAVTDVPGPLRSEASATGETRYGVAVTAAAPITVDVLTNPGLTITATRTGVAGIGETVAIRYTIANHGDLPVSALEVIDGVGEVLPLAHTTLEPGAAVEVAAARLITTADLPGPLLHTIAVRGQARDGQIVQVRGAATVQLAPPAASVIHLQPGARQTTQVGDASLIVATSPDFALAGVTAAQLDLTLAPAPPMADRRPEGMVASGLSLAVAVYADGEPSTDVHFTGSLHLIAPAPVTQTWAAYRWDDQAGVWSRTDVAVIDRDDATVTIGVQRAGIIALFAPEAAAPALATHLYLPVIQRESAR